jgi:hypothetical protein
LLSVDRRTTVPPLVSDSVAAQAVSARWGPSGTDKPTEEIGSMRLLKPAVIAMLGASFVAVGCGSGLSESSTCQDFLAADASSQQSIVQQLAGKYHKPAYATPLGMPEVPYYCASHADMTLKQFFSIADG